MRHIEKQCRDNIRKRMTALPIGVREFSKQAGVSRAHFINFMTGAASASLSWVDNIFEHLARLEKNKRRREKGNATE